MNNKYYTLLILGIVLLSDIFIATKLNASHDALGLYAAMNRVNISYFHMIFICVSIGLLLAREYSLYHSKYDELIINRVGNDNFLRKKILGCFTKFFIYRFLLDFSLIVVIHFFIYKINFARPITFNIFNHSLHSFFWKSEPISIFMYLILASIGTGIFATFIFLLIDYIKNKYVYICLPLILQFFSILTIFLLCGLLSTITGLRIGAGFNHYITYLSYFYAPVAILFPGMMFENLVVFNSIFSNLFYLIVIFILYKSVLNKRKRYG
ncbi:MAG: hypothetical protein SPI53_05640 [Erysipelotrichaceae bacterium]|nr:hypothetical protein [Erysipelotrichaceae bacterium]